VKIENMIRIKPISDDGFRVCMETLSRMGVAKKKEKLFFQSCYIIRVKGQFYIVYYKEILNKKMSDIDIARRNTIATLLEKWEMVSIENKEAINEFGTLPSVFVMAFKDKQNWKVSSKIATERISDFIEVVIKKSQYETTSPKKEEN
jgi:hypothetical protein